MCWRIGGWEEEKAGRAVPDQGHRRLTEAAGQGEGLARVDLDEVVGLPPVSAGAVAWPMGVAAEPGLQGPVHARVAARWGEAAARVPGGDENARPPRQELV